MRKLEGSWHSHRPHRGHTGYGISISEINRQVFNNIIYDINNSPLGQVSFISTPTDSSWWIRASGTSEDMQLRPGEAQGINLSSDGTAR